MFGVQCRSGSAPDAEPPSPRRNAVSATAGQERVRSNHAIGCIHARSGSAYRAGKMGSMDVFSNKGMLDHEMLLIDKAPDKAHDKDGVTEHSPPTPDTRNPSARPQKSTGVSRSCCTNSRIISTSRRCPAL